MTEVPQMMPFKNKFPYFFVIDEASDFKFGMQLRFAKAHHKILLEEKVGVVFYYLAEYEYI